MSIAHGSAATAAAVAAVSVAARNTKYSLHGMMPSSNGKPNWVCVCVDGATLCDESGNRIKRIFLAYVYEIWKRENRRAGERQQERERKREQARKRKERKADGRERVREDGDESARVCAVCVCMPNEIQLYTLLYGPRWVAFDRALVIYLLHISPLVLVVRFVIILHLSVFLCDFTARYVYKCAQNFLFIVLL